MAIKYIVFEVGDMLIAGEDVMDFEEEVEIKENTTVTISKIYDDSDQNYWLYFEETGEAEFSSSEFYLHPSTEINEG